LGLSIHLYLLTVLVPAPVRVPGGYTEHNKVLPGTGVGYPPRGDLPVLPPARCQVRET